MTSRRLLFAAILGLSASLSLFACGDSADGGEGGAGGATGGDATGGSSSGGSSTGGVPAGGGSPGLDTGDAGAAGFGGQLELTCEQACEVQFAGCVVACIEAAGKDCESGCTPARTGCLGGC
jgi:hypothetical protein